MKTAETLTLQLVFWVTSPGETWNTRQGNTHTAVFCIVLNNKKQETTSGPGTGVAKPSKVCVSV